MGFSRWAWSRVARLIHDRRSGYVDAAGRQEDQRLDAPGQPPEHRHERGLDLDGVVGGLELFIAGAQELLPLDPAAGGVLGLPDGLVVLREARHAEDEDRPRDRQDERDRERGLLPRREELAR